MLAPALPNDNAFRPNAEHKGVRERRVVLGPLQRGQSEVAHVRKRNGDHSRDAPVTTRKRLRSTESRLERSAGRVDNVVDGQVQMVVSVVQKLCYFAPSGWWARDEADECGRGFARFPGHVHVFVRKQGPRAVLLSDCKHAYEESGCAL